MRTHPSTRSEHTVMHRADTDVVGEPTTAGGSAAPRYLEPDRATRWFANPLVTALVRLGWSPRGAHELEVRGRTSGAWRTVPVNPIEVDGVTHLVAPRGETQWVRNLRAAGTGRLRVGRRRHEFSAVELDDHDKLPVLRAYLVQWAFEVGRFFEGVDADSSDEEVAAIAAGFPVFRIART